MHVLAADDVIRVWERGHARSPADRAIEVLAAGFPESGADELRRLSLGQCNTRLLALRERLFGPELQAFAECRKCRERLEFVLSGDVIRKGFPIQNSSAEFEFEFEGYALRFRPLNSFDLRAAAGCVNVAAAHKLLVRRCVLEARHGDEAADVEELPERVVGQLAARISECDPQAEVLIDIHCPACDSKWQMSFDIASFFYAEISVQAQNLIREVHALARAYAWSESDILKMSAQRRRHYLELLGQ